MITIHLKQLGMYWEIPEIAIPVTYQMKAGDEYYLPATLFLCPPCGYYSFDPDPHCPVCDNDKWAQYYFDDLEEED